MKAIGTNTAHSTSVTASRAPETSRIERCAASSAPTPSSRMIRSTFSTTTMASSTRMPIASTTPNSVITLSDSPSAYRQATVPSSETGTTITGISVARRLPRNRYRIRNTSTVASASVVSTRHIERCTNCALSVEIS